MQIRHRKIAALFCLCVSLFFLWMGIICGKTADGFLGNVTICAEEDGFDSVLIRQMVRQQESLAEKKETDEEREQNGEIFAAWTELADEAVSNSMGGKTMVTDVVAVAGPSHCLLPIGKNLFPQDVDGCIVGRELAEELSGTRRAEGQQLLWREKTWTVRGVVEEPARMFMVQTIGLKESVSFDRISIAMTALDDRRRMGEQFISRYGLAARTLRFDHCYGVRWLTELIPASWSDFDGWKQNWEQHRQAVNLIESSAKSSIEAVGIRNYKRRNVFIVLSLVLFFAAVKSGLKK